MIPGSLKGGFLHNMTITSCVVVDVASLYGGRRQSTASDSY